MDEEHADGVKQDALFACGHLFDDLGDGNTKVG